MTREMAVQTLLPGADPSWTKGPGWKGRWPRAAAVLHALEQADLAGLADLVHRR